MKKITTLAALSILLFSAQAPSIHAETDPYEFGCEVGYYIEDETLFYCPALEYPIEIPNADLDSLEILSSFENLDLAVDKNATYCEGAKTVLDIDTFESVEGSRFFFRDQHTVFFGCTEIESSDPETFEDLSGESNVNHNAQDANNAYFQDSILEVDRENFKVFEEGYYSGDDSNVYYRGKLVSEADAESFEVIPSDNIELHCGLYGVDAKDKNNYYSNGRIKCDVNFKETIESFPDLNEETDYITAIGWTLSEGITQGYQYGTWQPDTCVTRSQLLKMVLEYRFEDLEAEIPHLQNEIDFPDVKAGDWDHDYIQYAYFLEIVQGYHDGQFRPNDCVNRAEAMKIGVKALLPGGEKGGTLPIIYDDKLIADIEPSDWYAAYARFLFGERLMGSSHTTKAPEDDFDADYYSSIFEKPISYPIYFYPSEDMSRKEVAEMLFRIDGHKSNAPLKQYEIENEVINEPHQIIQHLTWHSSNGDEGILIQDLQAEYGHYFDLERGVIEGSNSLILKSTPPETDLVSQAYYSLNIETLELKPLKVNEVRMNGFEHDDVYGVISPSGQYMIWTPIFTSDNKDQNKFIFLVDLVNDLYGVYYGLATDETLISEDGQVELEWVEESGYKIKLAVYDASNGEFIKHDEFSVGTPFHSLFDFEELNNDSI